jgi:uncharacterized protein (TIGR03435 family)
MRPGCRLATALALGMFWWQAPARAQSSAADARPIAFEVASIKPNPSRDVVESVSVQSGGGVRMTGFRLDTLIRVAYAIGPTWTPDRIIGGPAWVRADRFDIVAKAEGDLMFDVEGRRPARVIAMLKTLLEDRFAVRVHTESRPMPAFELRLSRRDRRLGPQLHESTADCPRYTPGRAPAATDADRWCGVRRVPGRITARYVTMPEVATYFSGLAAVGRPIQDRTGLTGRYDLQLDFMEGPEEAGSFFTAFSEQLGLSLQGVRATLPVIVIDRAERPTPD